MEQEIKEIKSTLVNLNNNINSQQSENTSNHEIL